MKTLLLLRHAKSSWHDESLTDFERPLNERGLGAAPFMGEYMRRQGLTPEVIVSSPAKRARQTAELVRKAARIEPDIIFDKRIYEADVSTLLEVVAQFPAAPDKVLLVGHNPGFEALLNHLTGERQHLSTAALAEILLPIDEWSDATRARGTLASFARPRELMKDRK